jgi:uncharacterized protein
MDDRAVVEIQIRRPPRSAVIVESRCHLGLPVVTQVPPILDDGTPFPTTHWLTCPLAGLRIARLEADGGVKSADADLAADPDLARRFAEAATRYRMARDAMIHPGYRGPRPSGGIAGSDGAVKCLHAQYADTRAGNDNPIGERVRGSVEPLDCTVPCVIEESGRPVSNAEWHEPGGTDRP